MARALHVAVVGSGGREHALAWALAQSEDVERVVVLPGNAGTAVEAKVSNFPVAPSDLDGIVRFAGEKNVDVVVPGPEASLVAGLADRMSRAERFIFTFGPSRRAAMVTEGSKIAAMKFAKRHRIPIPESWCFTRPEVATRFLEFDRRPSDARPLVIKPDGLTGGKGVRIVRSLDEGTDAVTAAFAARHRGVVMQEYLEGFELTFTCAVAGDWVMPLPMAQDAKQWKGRMTGGMGAFSPVPFVNYALQAEICRQIVRPTIAGLLDDGISYVGFLYFGLVVVGGRPYLIEWNCRFGDPEAQVILRRVGGGIVPLILAARDPALRRDLALGCSPQAAFGVVLANDGYPGEITRVGDPISGLAAAASRRGIKVFHSGTAKVKSNVITAGGRVLTVTAFGEGIPDVREFAYAAAADISWPGCSYDPDIGLAALAESIAR